MEMMDIPANKLMFHKCHYMLSGQSTQLLCRRAQASFRAVPRCSTITLRYQITRGYGIIRGMEG